MVLPYEYESEAAGVPTVGTPIPCSLPGIRIRDPHHCGSGPQTPFGTSPALSVLGSSAESSWTHVNRDSFLLGTSPPVGSFEAPGSSFSGKDVKRNPAKRFWSRLLYDDSLDQNEFQVGFMEVFTCDQRKSGKEAWSERQQHQEVELSFEEFRSRFPSKDVPFHLILYFKQNGVIVWDSHKRETSPQLELEFSSLSMDSPENHSPAEDTDMGVNSAGLRGCMSELPRECWSIIMQKLGTRELCMLSRVNRNLRELCRQDATWSICFTNLFGAEPNPEYNTATVRRLCRRSELRAARWLEAPGNKFEFDFPGAVCMRVDDSKVISADGRSIRLWSHDTGRRISKLPGQTADVTCLTANDDLIIAGCSQSTVRVWGMDDLKFIRALRGHDGPITDVKMLNEMPLSASEDGTVRFWDPTQTLPVITLDADFAVHSLSVDCTNGQLTTAGWTLDVWDVATAQRLIQLANPVGDDDDLGLMFEMIESSDTGGISAFTKVSQQGAFLAAGSSGIVSLWDIRTASRINHLQLPDLSAKVTGLQLDEWKLLTSTEGSPDVVMYDIRALSGAAGALVQRHPAWPEPVKTFTARSDVTCFQFYGDHLVVGASDATLVWKFGHTAADASHCGADEYPAHHQPHCHGHKSCKEKKKPTKIAKGQRKYPKRTTR